MRYGKYSPKTLNEVIGQENISCALKNILKEKEAIPHAILFSGIHGIGKTLLARLFAKEINNSINYVAREIDAATYTGVDDVRQILEDVAYLPVETKYKVYIFDEVHMLSRSAFDALLYTLQDPPEYAIFIFTTTRIDKLPETFLSRCLHLQLSSINKDIMHQYITKILKEEHNELNNDIIDLIIQKSEGSLRQVFSTLDYILLLDDKSLDNIAKALKVIKYQDVLELFTYMLDGNVKKAIELQQQYEEANCNIKTLYLHLGTILKKLLLTILGIDLEMQTIVEKYEINTSLIAGWWEILLKNYEAFLNGMKDSTQVTVMFFMLLEEATLKKYTKKTFNIS